MHQAKKTVTYIVLVVEIQIIFQSTALVIIIIVTIIIHILIRMLGVVILTQVSCNGSKNVVIYTVPNLIPGVRKILIII